VLCSTLTEVVEPTAAENIIAGAQVTIDIFVNIKSVAVDLI